MATATPETSCTRRRPWALSSTLALIPILLLAALTGGCGSGGGESRVEQGDREGVLHITVGAEPEDLDPHIVTGVPEHHIMTSVIEGLVTEHPETLEPQPGVAERWERSENGLTWTFFLRENAQWSNGAPVTATDFVRSFQRILTPSLASKYSYMLFVMKNAEAYANGELTDFSQVGAKAIDDRTLQIELGSPTPYFLSLLNHYTWFPVPIDVVAEHGALDQRGNRWTRPENFVGNGAFTLTYWRTNDKITVEKSPTYWNADNVALNAIHFYAMESQNTQENAFRAGQLHNVYDMPLDKIQVYQRDHPELIHIYPYLSTYFYRLNTTQPPFDDVRVRRALAMAIDRQKIVDFITKGGQIPAFNLTPPNTAGFTAASQFSEDLAEAQRLLTEAGYPNGEGLPPVEILFNTHESHRSIAEAVQQMWLTNLGVKAELVNQEWKVYLDRQRNLDYQASRAGWTGDYPDPNTFLDMFTSWSQQNQTGWSNEAYDQLIRAAANTFDPEERYGYFHEAEALIMEEMPIIPLYFYTRVYALRPSVQGWEKNVLDHHPYQHLSLTAPAAEQ